MICASCFKSETIVTDSRKSYGGKKITRRRECLLCKFRFSTTESILKKSIEDENQALKKIIIKIRNEINNTLEREK